MKKESRGTKVAVIGAGFVGSTAAYAMLIEEAANEIVIIDINQEKAEGEALDLQHGLQFKTNTKITFGNSSKLCKDANIVIITAGRHTRPDQSRLDVARENSSLFKRLIPELAGYNGGCLILVVSNSKSLFLRRFKYF